MMTIIKQLTKVYNSACSVPSGVSASYVSARHGHYQIKKYEDVRRVPKFFKDPELFADDVHAEIEKEISKGKPSNDKKVKARLVRSFKKRTEAYMLPFALDVFLSARYIHASIMHRMTHKVVAVASTNSKDLRSVLKSRIDINACRVVGQILAERAMEADVFTCIYYTRKGEKLEGRLLAVVDSVREHGINILM